MKLFTTCTFEGLGSRKNDFLEKLTHKMQSLGLKPMSPEDSFFQGRREDAREHLFLGWRILRELTFMENSILFYSKKVGIVVIRTKERNGNLRVGSYCPIAVQEVGKAENIRVRRASGYSRFHPLVTCNKQSSS